MHPCDAYPPSCPWAAGRLIRASAWSGISLTGPDLILRTLPSFGDVAPEAPSAAWSLHLGLQTEPGDPEALFLSNGFVLRFPRQSGSPRVCCIMLQRGLLIIDAGIPLPAVLVSPGQTVQSDENTSHITTAEGTVALVGLAGAACRFALVVSRAGLPEAQERASHAAATDLDGLLEREFALRTAFYEQLAGSDTALHLVSQAVETLVFHLERGPEGEVERWSACDPRSDRRMHSAHLIPLVLAWLRLDPVVAAELVRGTLRQTRHRGAVPAVWDPLNPARATGMAWPCVCQALRAVFDECGDTEMLQELLPWAVRHLSAVIERLDPGRTGLPRWPRGEEAFLPPSADPGASPCDANALLLRDIDDLAYLAERSGDMHGLYTLAMADYRQRLVQQSEDVLWDRSVHLYRSRLESGAFAGRLELGGLLGMWQHQAPAERAERIAAAALDPDRLGTDEGVALWKTTGRTESTSPAPSAYQVFVVHAMRRAACEDSLSPLLDRIYRGLQRQWNASGTLPWDLRGPGSSASETDAPAWVLSPTLPASLALLVCPEVVQSTVPTPPPWLERIEGHVGLVATTVVIGIVLAVLLTSFAVNPRTRSPAVDSLAPLAAPLQTARKSEPLDVAVSAIRERVRTHEISAVHGLLLEGNLLFRHKDYAAAEQRFTQVVDDPELGPQALINMALAAFRQSRHREAARLYAEYLGQHADRNADWTYMAQTALAYLIENSVEADALKPPGDSPVSFAPAGERGE